MIRLEQASTQAPRRRRRQGRRSRAAGGITLPSGSFRPGTRRRRRSPTMRRIAGDRESPAKGGRNKAPPRSVRSGLASRRGRRWWTGGARNRNIRFFFVVACRPLRDRQRTTARYACHNNWDATKTPDEKQQQTASPSRLLHLCLPHDERKIGVGGDNDSDGRNGMER